MDSDSDSDASHISATPPRPAAPFRRPPLRSTPKPLLSNPKPQSKPKSHSTPKPSPPPPPPPPPPPDPPFPAADLSVLGLSVNLHRPSASNSTTPFSSLVRSRRPSFNPSDFNEIRSTPQIPDPETVPDVQLPPTKRAKCTPKSATPGPVKVHPNWIGPDVPPERQLNRPLKCSSEGNFVRLNINGHGRKYGYKFTKRGSANSFRGRRFRRRIVSERPQASGGGEMGAHVSDEEDVMDTSCEQRGKTKHGSEVIDEAVVAVREDASEENLVNLLKLTHGYDSFREGQLETIKQVLAGESMMLVLPTGAGKSLCYQLPALVLPGLTLVVSPLVALMVDQLRQLPLVIPGGLLSSSQTIEEASITLRRLREGSIKVLFVSPERFLNAEFISIFGDNLSISLLVIDEAHCISEWSHNFRPSYLRLRASVLQSKLKVECFLAMTATATTQTLHDILNSLDIPPTNLIHTCQMRKNLQLSVTLSDNRLKDILSLMKSPPLVGKRSIIIYCKFQVETDIVSKYLKDNNIPAKAYHGGILAKNRSRIQELFCSNKIRVVVATVAFGMGLDKSDVEGVINYSLPESLEEYVQETGRAGRDGRLSFCHLFLDYPTYYRLRSLAYSDGVDEYTIGRFLSHIFSTDAGDIRSLVKESASRKFDMKEEVLLTILTQMEMGDVQYLRLLPQINVTCTLYFHKTPPAILSSKDLLIAAIMKKSEMKQQGHYVFDIPTVASHAGITTTDLQNQLQKLKSLGEIMYDLKDPAYCFEIMKKPDDFCSLTGSLTKWLSAVERCKVQKLDAMFHVANYAVKECRRVDGCADSMHTPCIQRKISEYFSRDRNTPYDDCSINVTKSSPFLRADIKVFLQSNLNAKFTPRAVARIMHGIPSPAFPSSTWSKGHFWGRYVEVEFPTVLEAATLELMNFVGKGGV